MKKNWIERNKKEEGGRRRRGTTATETAAIAAVQTVKWCVSCTLLPQQHVPSTSV